MITCFREQQQITVNEMHTHTHLAKHSTEHTPDDFFEGVKEQVLSPWLG